MAIAQWRIFNVPHLLWQGPTLYNGHLRGRVTLTPVAESDNEAEPTCFIDLNVSRPGIEPRSPACEPTALPLRQDIVFLVMTTFLQTSDKSTYNKYLSLDKST